VASNISRKREKNDQALFLKLNTSNIREDEKDNSTSVKKVINNSVIWQNKK
jgi:hypothetical protein